VSRGSGQRVDGNPAVEARTFSAASSHSCSSVYRLGITHDYLVSQLQRCHVAICRLWGAVPLGH
jgi:hypothetical protein